MGRGGVYCEAEGRMIVGSETMADRQAERIQESWNGALDELEGRYRDVPNSIHHSRLCSHRWVQDESSR